MPGGRVQPVVVQKVSEKKTGAILKLSQSEATRKRAIAAQQALVVNNARAEEDHQNEKKMQNDALLRQQHEAKLNETAGDEVQRQRDADDELAQFQSHGLLIERQRQMELEAATALQLEQDALVEHARRAALEEKSQESFSHAPEVPHVQDVSAPVEESVHALLVAVMEHAAATVAAAVDVPVAELTAEVPVAELTAEVPVAELTAETPKKDESSKAEPVVEVPAIDPDAELKLIRDRINNILSEDVTQPAV